MNLFNQIKEQVTARQVAEGYGLAVGRNGMACCPFHDDKHPSLKVDKGFYCFGCGEKGDAIAYAAKLYEISQYEAALKIADDFNLSINRGFNPEEKKKVNMRIQERNRVLNIKERFQKWCNNAVDLLHEASWDIYDVEQAYKGLPVEDCFNDDFTFLMHSKSKIEYWLDILCIEDDITKQEFFLAERKEVERLAERIKGAKERLLTSDWRNLGYGDAYCG